MDVGVQTHEVWSTEEEDHLCPGQFWICKFGTVPGSMSCVEWDPSAGADDASAPVVMLVNSSEQRAADFHLEEVSPLQLDEVSRGRRRTRGVAVRKLQVVGNSTFVLSVENDNDFRSRCE